MEGTTTVSAKPLSRFQKWKTVLQPPQGTSLIWWMIDLQRQWWKQVFAFFAFIIMFRLLGFTAQQSLVMVVSMFLHELGHAIAFYRNDIKFVLLYLFPLGAVAAPSTKEENARSDQLSWYLLSILLLAGPAVNIGLMLVGKVLVLTSPSTDVQALGHDVIYINGLLAFMNLIPVWKLDAGQFFKLIYSSLNERHDRFLTIAFTLATAVIIGAVLISAGMQSLLHLLRGVLLNLALVSFGVVFVMSTWYGQGKDNPDHATSPLRLTKNQLIVTMTIFFVLIFTGLWVIR